MKTVTINVRPEHIDRGLRQSCCRCPIALAVCDALGCEADDVWVDMGQVIVNNESASLPEKAVDFYKAFDDGDAVEPFSFETEFLQGPVSE